MPRMTIHPPAKLQAHVLRSLERDARKLLIRCGDTANSLDSARLGLAIGHIAHAIDNLSNAAAVLEARAKNGE